MSAEKSHEKILIIEDTPDIAQLICDQLRDLGIPSYAVSSGEEGLRLALSQPFLGFIVDLMLPGIGGFEICRRIRAAKIHAPIMILTSKNETIDKVMGFDSGADDFLTKPFDLLEFNARIRSLLRRAQQGGWHAGSAAERRDLLVLGDLSLDVQGVEAKICDRTLELTRTEFELLVLLMSNPGTVFSREDLVEQVWGSTLDAYTENITTHISRLRMKLSGEPDYSNTIVTVRGIGYRFLRADEWPAGE